MDKHYIDLIKAATGATMVNECEIIQQLWSGYGTIRRMELIGCSLESVVVKYVQLPEKTIHPRGWDNINSHNRKVRSYEVETAFYQRYSNSIHDNCYLPTCHAVESVNNEVFMVMEDLDASGFDERKNAVDIQEIEACLNWLANFHAVFMGQEPTGLWPIGTYWHLDTRPDELDSLTDLPLKKAASKIDKKLNNCRYKTFVHGDAKLANFCFSKSSNKVAAVDFQYIGGGCGMKDVAYFIGSCMSDRECEKHEQYLLDFYFKSLQEALLKYNNSVNPSEVESEWRSLYAVAWTDFHRFIKGWSPGHWKINSYSERLASEVIKSLS